MTAVTSASVVEDASDGGVTAVVDIDIDVDLFGAPVDQALEFPVTTVSRLAAWAVDADPFETVTAVENPDQLLLAMMRRGDGRAEPAIIEAPALSEPAFAEPTFAPPAIAPATFPAVDHAALAAVPIITARRPWRTLAAAGAFAVLLCVIAVTTVFDRPTAAVPASTFAPAHESLDSAVVTAREQAPPVADPKPAVTNSKPRARPITVERPSPRPVARPLYRPAPPKKKCRNLGCL
jgi:hypothetical protein